MQRDFPQLPSYQQFCEGLESIDECVLDELGQSVRKKMYNIIECKEATYFGVASCITDLCRIIAFDQKRVVFVSCYVKEFDICISVPVVLSRFGIERHLPLGLNEQEQELYRRSIERVQEQRDLLKDNQIG